MSGQHRARRGVLRLLAGSALAAAVALVGAVPVAAPTSAVDRYEVDVARRADFVPQTTFVQCVGASLQMMINMIEPGPLGKDPVASPEARPEDEPAAS